MAGTCGKQTNEDKHQRILNSVCSTYEKLERQGDKLDRQESRLSNLVDRINAQESFTETMQSSVIQGWRLNELSSDMERRNVNIIIHGLQEICGISDENILHHLLVNDLGIGEDKIKSLAIINTKELVRRATE